MLNIVGQLRSQNANTAGRLSCGIFAVKKLRLERVQHAGHNTTDVRYVRYMHQRRSAGHRVETRYGHDRIFDWSFDQAHQRDVNEKMLKLRASNNY